MAGGKIETSAGLEDGKVTAPTWRTGRTNCFKREQSAEDNAANRALAQRLLQKRGFVVFIATDGKQAIVGTQSAEFDLILMDIQMPEMDGFEATAEIRKREKVTGRRTPIVALTAHALKKDRERCLSAGMDAYVTKPIRPAELFVVIQNVLQSSADGNASTCLTPAPSSR